MSIQIEWSKATPEEEEAAHAFLTTLLPDGQIPSHANVLFRLAELSFYPHLVMIEVTDLGANGDAAPPPWAGTGAPVSEGAQPARTIYVLGDPEKGRVTLLDMTSRPIYGLNNDGQLELTPANVAKYLGFFRSTVAGPYGVMPVIENLALPPDAEIDASTKQQLEALKPYIPPSIASQGEAGFRLRAALLFQGAVFKTTNLITPTGEVTIEEHELALASGDEQSAEDEAPESKKDGK